MLCSSIINQLRKPEYFFKPKQIVRRTFHSIKRNECLIQDVRLPWAVTLRVRSTDAIGRALIDLGVYDLALTETVLRLVEPGDHVIDVGANIGYVSSIMGARVGRFGHVFSFEPHPDIFIELLENKDRWQQLNSWIHVTVQNVALSNKAGEGILTVPVGFDRNRGTAALIDGLKTVRNTTLDVPVQSFKVPVARLDELFGSDSRVRFIKIDVEGHELQVLEGARSMLINSVRDIAFEEHGVYPTAVTNLLESLGYSIFRIVKNFWGPQLEKPTSPRNANPSWEAPNFLATKDPNRATRLIRKKGWRSLSPC